MFQQMKYFIAVVEEHNFTRAAEKCHISQSAISQQIKELENNIGTPLVKRVGRSFTLTAAGQYFYQHSAEIVGSVNQLVTDTQQIAKDTDEKYILHLGYLANFGTKEFLHAVTRFTQQYPNAQVSVKSGNHEELFKLIREDRIDLNFSDLRRALSPEYENFFLTQSDFMAMLPKETFKDHRSVRTDELIDLPCILVVEDDELAAERDYCEQVLGVKSQFVRAKTVDDAQIMVATGQGFMIMNERTQSQLDSNVVQALPLFNGDHQLHQQYYAFWKKDNSGYYIEAFAQILKQEFDS